MYALGIRNVGVHISQVLENHFEGNFNLFMISTKEELISIFEVGNHIADQIIQFWKEISNIDIVRSCFNLGVVLQPLEIKPLNTLLTGKTFVFTGTLTSFTRREAKDLVKSLGGKHKTSVSNNTDFIVVGKSSGSKLIKAQQLGIHIIHEKEFQKMISQE